MRKYALSASQPLDLDHCGNTRRSAIRSTPPIAVGQLAAALRPLRGPLEVRGSLADPPPGHRRFAATGRDVDGKATPVNIVVSKRVDHYEYRNGKPAPVWEEVCHVSSVPYISSASHKSFPTVMAFLDDPSSGGGGGAVPYVVAWWAKAPMSSLLSAVVGALLIGLLWPLAIRRAKDVGPFLSRLCMALLARWKFHAPLVTASVPAPAVHYSGDKAVVEPPAPPPPPLLGSSRNAITVGKLL
jgi:hypothetical protein